jgi:hypothetical protein
MNGADKALLVLFAAGIVGCGIALLFPDVRDMKVHGVLGEIGLPLPALLVVCMSACALAVIYMVTVYMRKKR